MQNSFVARSESVMWWQKVDRRVELSILFSGFGLQTKIWKLVFYTLSLKQNEKMIIIYNSCECINVKIYFKTQ